MNTVQQTGQQQKEGLEQAAPEPINDDDDTVGGAAQQAQDTAEDAGDEAEDTADDATEKAGQTVESADDQTDDQQEQQDDEQQQQQQQQGGGLLKGAQGLAGKANLARNVCVWNYLAVHTGTTRIHFTGSPVCGMAGAGCAPNIQLMQLTFTIDVQN